MATTVDESEAKLRELARSLDCFTSSEFRFLGNIKETTEEAWRKRGVGPEYFLLGNTYLYPIPGVREFLQTKVRKPRGVPPKDQL